MPRVAELQPWITLQANSAGAVLQEMDEWMDTQAAGMAIVQVEAPNVTSSGGTCTLALEGCEDAGGSFVSHTSWTAGQTLAQTVRLSRDAPYGSTQRLLRYLRQVLGISGATLTLESAPTLEGPFSSVAAYTGATTTPLAVAADGPSNVFSRYIRWRVNGAGDWSICFQLRAKPSACTRSQWV